MLFSVKAYQTILTVFDKALGHTCRDAVQSETLIENQKSKLCRNIESRHYLDRRTGRFRYHSSAKKSHHTYDVHHDQDNKIAQRHLGMLDNTHDQCNNARHHKAYHIDIEHRVHRSIILDQI